MVWYDKAGTKHRFLLKDALYHPDSPVNVISVTKLGQDECDSTLNIKTFPIYSIFTWNHSCNSQFLRHSTVNLSELPIYPTLHYSTFTTHRKDNQISLSKEDQLALFKNVSSSELHNLINSPSLSPLQQEYQYYHHKFKCISKANMQHLINLGILPKRLASVQAPPCIRCLIGKSKKKPWRRKGQSPSIRHINHSTPGASISVDQLVSSTPGIKPQSKGCLTNTSIVGAQIFADHCSSPPFLHCHLLENFSGDEAIKAKVGFERSAATFNVSVRHYRADNGRFAEEAFVNACTSSGQTIDFCGVGAHFQNGIAESNIGYLQDTTRAVLLHAIRMWPEMISLELWSLALLETTRISNHLRFTADGRTPYAHFSKSDALLTVKDEHTFGCPVYILDASLQNGQQIPKWDSRVRIGIYVGKSPFHAGSVSLIMDTTTGLISPQYHCVYDDSFTSVDDIRAGRQPPNWNDLARHSTSFTSQADFIKASKWQVSPVHPPEQSSILGFGSSNSPPSVDIINKTSSPNIPKEHTYYAPIDTEFPKLLPLPDTPPPVLPSDNNNRPCSNDISPISNPAFDLFPYRSVFEYSTSPSSSSSILDSVYTLPFSDSSYNPISVCGEGGS